MHLKLSQQETLVVKLRDELRGIKEQHHPSAGPASSRHQGNHLKAKGGGEGSGLRDGESDSSKDQGLNSHQREEGEGEEGGDMLRPLISATPTRATNASPKAYFFPQAAAASTAVRKEEGDDWWAGKGERGREGVLVSLQQQCLELQRECQALKQALGSQKQQQDVTNGPNEVMALKRRLEAAGWHYSNIRIFK